MLLPSMYKHYLTMYIVQLHNNNKLPHDINFVTVTRRHAPLSTNLNSPRQASRDQLVLKDRTCTCCKLKSIVTIFVSQNNVNTTLGSRGYFFLIDTDGWRRSCVNEEKYNLWSQEYATSFPCEKSVLNLNWVTDWILPCPQGINNIIKALIGYIEQLDMGVSNR